jgi:hypothetical protein
MKSFKTLLSISLISVSVLLSCSKDNNGSKVGVEKGQISITGENKTHIYKIETIQSSIKGDTTSIIIRAVSKDSASEYLIIGFYKMINFKTDKYILNRNIVFDPDTTFNFAYLYFEDSGIPIPDFIKNASIEVVDYYANDILQAKFTFDIPNEKDTTDSTASIKYNGELNLDYADYDPEKVENLPISPNTMNVNINDSFATFKAISAHITSFGQDKYSINGTLGTKTIVIELVDFDPKINVEYSIGDSIDTVGYVTATYSTNNETTFWADGRKGTSGKIKISKITSSTLQGYFEFKAILGNDTTKKKELKKGMFYTKLKNQ